MSVNYRELAVLLDSPKGTGKTTSMVNQAKERGATVIVTNPHMHLGLGKAHQIDTVGLKQLHTLHGLRKPLLIDHHAISTVLLEMQNEIDRLTFITNSSWLRRFFSWFVVKPANV